MPECEHKNTHVRYTYVSPKIVVCDDCNQHLDQGTQTLDERLARIEKIENAARALMSELGTQNDLFRASGSNKDEQIKCLLRLASKMVALDKALDE